MDALRILIADDDTDTVLTLSSLLSSAGYCVRGVDRGADVIQALFSFAPDVVLLDTGMPRMSGFEVARVLRERFGSARPALVAVTGLSSEAEQQQARAAGFEHHIAKPCQPGAVLSLIRELAAGVLGRGGR